MVVTDGLSFDDVLLVPQYSEVLPAEVELVTSVSRNLQIKIPILSAAMDTVTEAETAITMAQHGGVGVIHKNNSIERQGLEVGRVKRSEAGLISDPIIVAPDNTVAEALEMMRTNGISGLPVVENSCLVGMLTGRDLRFEEDRAKLVAQVMTTAVITASQGTTTREALKILHKHRIEKLPIIDGDKLCGLFTIKDIKKARQFPDASKDSSGRLIVGAAIDTDRDSLARIEELLAKGCDLLVMDTAHAHSKTVLDSLKKIKKSFKRYNYDLLAGNVATADGVEALIDVGVDAVKVGVGPGSICTTRIIAGIGVPQLTAIINCAVSASKKGVTIIADGGVRFSGDIVKALAAGASAVMIGSLFGGTDEAPGEIILYEGKTYKSYRGMGSIAAMQAGSKVRYQQGGNNSKKLVPEGIEGLVPYSGSLSDNLQQLVGGLRSGMGYLGARTINDISRVGQFVRISAAGLRESHVHDVVVTREAPNYRR